MEREARTIAATIAAGAAESSLIDVTWAAGLGLKTPAALEAETKIAFKVAECQDGTFLPLYDDTNTLVEITVTLNEARAYALPDEIFYWRYIKLWTEAAGMDVAQTAERAFVITLKS